MSYRLICGDAIEAMRELPANSVQMVCCSPPYYALRSYLPDDHPDKALEIGTEQTPDEYVARLVDVFREVRRVLHMTGQLFVNIGDSRSDSRQWLGVPHRLVFALQADGWRWEDEVIWSKPNPMPGSQENRFTRSHEYVFMLNKSRDAFFDGEAVAEPSAYPGDARHLRTDNKKVHEPMSFDNGSRARTGNPTGATRTRRSVWAIATEPTPIAHYATFPTKLVEPCVLAGTSAKGCCAACGSPYERVVERAETDPMQVQSRWGRTRHADPRDKRGVGATVGHKTSESPRTTGWAATCTCGADVKPCVVLDPFFGSGTTAAVALKHGRHFIGIDLDERNIELARTRIEQSQPMLIGDIT